MWFMSLVFSTCKSYIYIYVYTRHGIRLFLGVHYRPTTNHHQTSTKFQPPAGCWINKNHPSGRIRGKFQRLDHGRLPPHASAKATQNFRGPNEVGWFFHGWGLDDLGWWGGIYGVDTQSLFILVKSSRDVISWLHVRDCQGVHDFTSYLLWFAVISWVVLTGSSLPFQGPHLQTPLFFNSTGQIL